MAAPTSPAWATRPSGTPRAMRRPNSGSAKAAPMPSPAVAPGHTQLTRMPRAPYWTARSRVSATTAPLLAV